MSGHSKWATTKRQKAVTDAKRSAVFTKLANAITIAARSGGDVEMNFALRLAVDRAKGANMPKNNIERAIQRGSGSSESAALEELTYEGFGPAGAAFIVEAVTDNKNRTASDVRSIFTKNGGTLGSPNSVSWNFERKGIIRMQHEECKKIKNTEELELELIDAGVADILKEEEGWTLYTSVENLQHVKQCLDAKNITVDSAELGYLPKEVKTVSEDERKKIEQFIDVLDDTDDISNYYTDVDL